MADKLLKYDVAMKSTKTVWQMDTPKCYTGDENTVTFDFNITDLLETDLVGVAPNVYLYMRDGSFFQNGPADGVKITGTKVNYTMKGNEGKHSGIAKAQLVLIWENGVDPVKKLTSQLYEFEIINGLETKVDQEVMIYDWTTLTRDAQAYIDQFNLNETTRQQQFSDAQAQRTTDFGAAQTQRTTDFNTAEQSRTTAFNAAESARAEGYTADHGRAETDHTTAAADHTTAGSDHTIAAADHTLAASDHTTALADHSIVQGYDTRLIAEETATANNKISAVKGKTFADVDARLEELETQAITVDARTEFEAKNEVVNGDFSNGATGWLGNPNFIVDGSLKWKTAVDGFYNWYQAKNYPAGNKIYARMRVTNNSVPADLRLYVGSVGTNYPGTSISVIDVGTKDVSGIITTPSGATHIGIKGQMLSTAVDTTIDNVLLIDLTATFGAGKEPTLAEMDRLMARFPNSWFDGVKPIQTIETLYQEKANKVQEAWITPTLLNGWKSVDSYRSIQYMKDEIGFVHLRGDLDPALKSSDYVLVLPVGYRPSRTMFWNINQGYVAITHLGQIHSAGITGWHTLHIISFRAEQ